MGEDGTPSIGPQHSKAVGHPWPLFSEKGGTQLPGGAPTSPTTGRHGGHPHPPRLGRMMRGTPGPSLPQNKAPGSPGGAPWQHPEGGGAISC